MGMSTCVMSAMGLGISSFNCGFIAQVEEERLSNFFGSTRVRSIDPKVKLGH